MEKQGYNFFDLAGIKARFPEQADSMIVDAYLSDHAPASSRLFRLYHALPRHYHESCDEHLVLLDGEAEFIIADDPPRRLSAGQMVTFLRNTVHSILPVAGKPAIFLTVDAPRRIPEDVHFVDPRETYGRAFVTHLADYPAQL